jgi:hypothetical protein
MNPRSGSNDKNKHKPKVASVLPLAAAIVIAGVLLSALSIMAVQEGFAQENGTLGAANETAMDTTQQPIISAENPCDPVQFAGLDQNATTANATTIDQQQDTATMMSDNVTTLGVTQQNQSLDEALHNELRMFIWDTCVALQVNDIRGAAILLFQAFDAIEDLPQPTQPNMTAPVDTQTNVTDIIPGTEPEVEDGGGFQQEPGNETQPLEDGGFLERIFG